MFRRSSRVLASSRDSRSPGRTCSRPSPSIASTVRDVGERDRRRSGQRSQVRSRLLGGSLRTAPAQMRKGRGRGVERGLHADRLRRALAAVGRDEPPGRDERCGDPKAEQDDYGEAHVSSLLDFTSGGGLPGDGASATSCLCAGAGEEDDVGMSSVDEHHLLRAGLRSNTAGLCPTATTSPPTCATAIRPTSSR